MAEAFLIIDGYNLMHAAGMARLHYGPGDLERCRNKMLGFLRRHLTPAQRERATVVFDAGDAPAGLPRSSKLEGMTVLFARRGGDADSLIEQLLAEHSAPRRIRLVSSDRRLQKAARRRRAKALASETFFTRLESRGPAAERRDRHGDGSRLPAEKISGPQSEQETSQWLEVFGEIPEAAELAGEAERLQRELDDLADDFEK